jgi:TRAP-type C4-dicarboxylate transport system permease small subunit
LRSGDAQRPTPLFFKKEGVTLVKKGHIFWKALAKTQTVIMVSAGIIVTLIISVEMLLRFIFDSDIKGYEEIVLMIAFWLYMIGSSYGSYEKSQITADILNIFLKEGKAKSLIGLTGSALTLGLGLWFNIWAFQFLQWSLEMDTRSPVWRLPTALGESSVFVGLTLMTFYNAVYFRDEIVGFLRCANSKQGGDLL